MTKRFYELKIGNKFEFYSSGVKFKAIKTGLGVCKVTSILKDNCIKTFDNSFVCICLNSQIYVK